MSFTVSRAYTTAPYQGSIQGTAPLQIIVVNGADIKATRSFRMVCATCGETETTQRRKGSDGKKTLCNACGLRYSRKLQADSEVRRKMNFSNFVHTIDKKRIAVPKSR